MRMLYTGNPNIKTQIDSNADEQKKILVELNKIELN
jgi:hypothetical protein